MPTLRLSTLPLLLWLVGLVAGCSQGNSGDEPAAGAAAGVPAGLDRFLTFPNPVVEPAGSFETTATAYAQAYYDAVDPHSQKTTLTAWKSSNNFGAGTEHTVVFRDVRDLGYGRRMTGHYDADRIAFFVENYQVIVPGVPGGGYATINVDAAVARDPKWHIGTNAIEWSCHPDDNPATCVKYAKYYNFSPNGQRQLTIDMDGRGQKAMPGPCITCHGGRGDPLDPGGLFPRVENTVTALAAPATRRRGDVQARLHVFDVDTFEWATTPGFTRADQEARLKEFNLWVLCSYPTPNGSAPRTEANGCVRSPAGANDWQGTSAVALLEAAYGGTGLPTTQFSEPPVPAAWSGSPALYQQVVVPYCRTCHILRGTNNQSDIDFDSKLKFDGYADRIKVHVFDRGNMPLALLVYQAFWKSTAPGTLASYLDSLSVPGVKATNSAGAALQPGRPIADAGPAFRMAQQGTAAPLSGANSLFAGSYSWSVTDPPGAAATIANPNAQVTSFTASMPGLYTVQLTVTAGSQSDSKTTRILVPDINDPNFSFPDPSTVKFAQVVDVLRNHPYGNNTSCTTSCHVAGAVAPILYDEPDLAVLLARVRGRVNLTDIAASPLLRKPTGNHHKGLEVIALGAITDPNPLANLNLKAALGSFSKLYYWILNGMPPGGVAANILAGLVDTVHDTANPDGSFQLTFAGGTPTAVLALDGSNSIGATTYAWSIVPAPVPPSSAIISPPTASTATLSLQKVGTFNVQLTVTGGGATDIATKTIVVTEVPLTFGLTVVGGGDVSLSGAAPGAGTISVNTAQNTGLPVTCNWQVTPLTPPFTADVTVGTNACTGATLNVVGTAVGKQYSVSLTQQGVDLTVPAVTVAQTFTVTAPPAAADFSFPSPNNIGFTINGDTESAPAARINGVATSSIPLTANAFPTAGLSYAWVVTSSGTAGCSVPSTNSATVALTVQRAGSCAVQLTVSNSEGSLLVPAKTVTIGSTRTFENDIRTLFVNSGCTTACHKVGGTASASHSWENTAGLKDRLLNVIDTDPGAAQSSLLLLCPSQGGCDPSMGKQTGFANGMGTAGYDTVLTWIINGTP